VFRISLLLLLLLTKRGNEKSPSNGHCQCQKERDRRLLACQQFLTESHKVTRFANNRASFLNMNDINVISFFWNVWLLSLLYYRKGVNAHSMISLQITRSNKCTVSSTSGYTKLSFSWFSTLLTLAQSTDFNYIWQLRLTYHVIRTLVQVFKPSKYIIIRVGCQDVGTISCSRCLSSKIYIYKQWFTRLPMLVISER
jgi:hypothetical protein